MPARGPESLGRRGCADRVGRSSRWPQDSVLTYRPMTQLGVHWRNPQSASVRFLALFVGLICGFISPAFAARSVGDLSLKDLQGNQHDLSEFRGKIVVLNFWATWCMPCREEMPIFVRLQERRGAEGVQVVGASADEPGSEAAVEKFIHEMGVGFPIWIGATTVDMERLDLGTALPATAILDRDGTVVARAPGIVDEAGLNRWIDWLLGDRTASAPLPPIRVPIPPAAAEGHGHDHHHHGTGVGLDGPSLVPS
jgi:thiol-disulfide isomerase/thioredoxin